jgi:hypothetical protein
MILCALCIFFRDTEHSATNLHRLDAEDFHCRDTAQLTTITITFVDLSSDRSGRIVVRDDSYFLIELPDQKSHLHLKSDVMERRRSETDIMENSKAIALGSDSSAASYPDRLIECHILSDTGRDTHFARPRPTSPQESNRPKGRQASAPLSVPGRVPSLASQPSLLRLPGPASGVHGGLPLAGRTSGADHVRGHPNPQT